MFEITKREGNILILFLEKIRIKLSLHRYNKIRKFSLKHANKIKSNHINI